VDSQIGLRTHDGAPSFAKSLAQVCQSPWLSGNHIRTLPNGDAFFPPMIQAIKEAKKTITFETFAFVDAPITREVTKALAAKASEGVAVHLILDQVGSRKAGEYNINWLTNAGVKFYYFNPLNLFAPKKSNNRTHRKILVIDGQVAFTGGAGFAHAWSGNAQSAAHWRDTQYEIKGPAVAEIQKSFAENWFELSGQKLGGPSYFPHLEPAGNDKIQVVSDGPNNKNHPIAHAYLAAINGARHSLMMEQSYFIPTTPFRNALIRAAKRGVRISILVPSEQIDSKPTRWASQNHWQTLLKQGIKIFEYQPTMMHAKLMVVDEKLSVIGSSNFDERSFFINDEINLHVDSTFFAQQQLQIIQEDLAKSREVTLANLPERLAPRLKRIPMRLLETQL